MSRDNVVHLLVVRESELLTQAGTFSPRKQNRAIAEAGILPYWWWRKCGHWVAVAGPLDRKRKTNSPGRSALTRRPDFPPVNLEGGDA